jgi:predicted Zn-dependent peptidase
MKRYPFVLFLAMVLFSATATAATLAEKVQEHRLDNGATLLMVERQASPTIAAYISFRVGSANETSEQRGAAHLLEHMLFKGTKTLGTRNYAAEQPLLRRIEEVGSRLDDMKIRPDADEEKIRQLRAQLQELQQQHRQFVIKDEFARIYSEAGGVGYNAFTGKDLTTYLINLPANKLELWAAIESDRWQNAVFREFYTERDVVREERRRSYESNPQGMLYESLLAMAYKVHPYGEPIIGWPSDIEQLQLEEIRNFFTNYYRPANMVITLVGDFEAEAAIALVERYFGRLEAGVPVPPVADREPEQQGERRVTINFDAEKRLMIAFHKPTMPEADDYVFDILMQVLTDGRTSRLYQSLVLEQQLVSDVEAYSAPGSRYDNLMILSMTPRQNSSYRDVEEAVYAELERLKREPISQAELDKARKQIKTSFLRRMRSNSGLARMLSSFEILGDWRYLVNYTDKLARVTSADLMAVATRYLQQDNRTVAILGRGVQG